MLRDYNIQTPNRMLSEILFNILHLHTFRQEMGLLTDLLVLLQQPPKNI